MVNRSSIFTLECEQRAVVNHDEVEYKVQGSNEESDKNDDRGGAKE